MPHLAKGPNMTYERLAGRLVASSRYSSFMAYALLRLAGCDVFGDLIRACFVAYAVRLRRHAVRRCLLMGRWQALGGGMCILFMFLFVLRPALNVSAIGLAKAGRTAWVFGLLGARPHDVQWGLFSPRRLGTMDVAPRSCVRTMVAGEFLEYRPPRHLNTTTWSQIRPLSG